MTGFVLPDLIFDEDDPEGLAPLNAATADDMAMRDHNLVANNNTLARLVPPMDMETAEHHLGMHGIVSVSSTWSTHRCQLPSNMPCEDVMDLDGLSNVDDRARAFSYWTIFDGHAGPATAQLLTPLLALTVISDLDDSGYWERSYRPDDYHTALTIKKAFRKVDDSIMQRAAECLADGEGDLAFCVSRLAPAAAGSCALLALFDHLNSVLRVANTGDSRAVLGRWDESASKYAAQIMSVDQTGFNQNEVQRLRQEHPDEDPVDPKTGRVHGLAISRAFGDSRWKWSQAMSNTIYEKFWGPTPRPDGMIKTPPYLTAEPEIIETKIHTGDNADFLIMASDGLWDHMSSEDAVTCVQQWIEQRGKDSIIPTKPPQEDSNSVPHTNGPSGISRKYEAGFENDSNEDDETYWDETEKAMKWRVSPKHFAFEDDNCAAHLIRNALGGKRKNLFRGGRCTLKWKRCWRLC